MNINKLLCWTTLMFALLFSAPSWATWTMVQHPKNTACTTSNTTCAVTMTQSTGSGNVLIAVMGDNSSADTISSITSAACTGTWTLCTTLGCHASDSTAAVAVDMAYCLNSASGQTSISITRTGGTTGWTSAVFEYSFTAGNTVAIDTGSGIDDSTSTTPQNGPALTLSGSNDLIVQTFRCGTTKHVTAVSGTYTNPADFSSNQGWAGSINTSSGTAPSWTLSGAARGAGAAIAVKEIAAAGTCNNHIALMGVGCK